MYWKPILKGAVTFVPGLLKAIHSVRGSQTGGSDSARYCYSVWLRHLVRAHQVGLGDRLESVAELGPGDSLGVGLAALLSGAARYYAFDVVRYAPTERNTRVLDELVELFRARAPIPDNRELPGVFPKLSDYAFPEHILKATHVTRCLSDGRVEAIRRALAGTDSRADIEITYVVPWSEVERESSVDLVFSRACLEHVDDLESAYDAMYRWLRTGGYVSHQIDFQCHGITPQWDGHRQYPDMAWKLVRGMRPYMINREPFSRHRQLLEQRFDVRHVDIRHLNPETPRERLAARFRHLSNTDRGASGAFVIAVKRDGATCNVSFSPAVASVANSLRPD